MCSIVLFLIFAFRITLTAQSATDTNLPAGAVVIERAPIPQNVHKDRELVLWMLSPERHDRGEFSESDPYTCPEMTLGSYYSGPTRISLLDASTGKVINTVDLRHAYGAQDSFDIPYRILPDYAYLVPEHEKGSEGTPRLLALRDLNGDGLPLETAFFEALACMGLETTLIGYSPRRDQVIQYEVELKIAEQRIVEGGGIVSAGKGRTELANWVDYLFDELPAQPGRWSYKIDYTGRGGALNSYDVHYDLALEKFFGNLTILAPPLDVQ